MVFTSFRKDEPTWGQKGQLKLEMGTDIPYKDIGKTHLSPHQGSKPTTCSYNHLSTLNPTREMSLIFFEIVLMDENCTF
jgi:hypothetical protein